MTPIIKGLAPDLQEIKALINTAQGIEKADLVIKGGNLVNVYTAELLENTSIAIKGKRVAYFGKNIEPLKNVVLRAVNQYPGQSENINHIIKSLVYFVDAENDPEPKLFFSANWKQVKRFFSSEAKKLMEELLK